ncbi:MAG: RNA 2',3'-cyclic phosphodiesterase [Clostridia bacterium]|nr:RNA 2',3'-cyclic phosphodiesterase [Clostridia bacterium]
MRLFAAIRLDPAFVSALKMIQDGMKNAGIRGNYTKPENLHITLAFIGEYNDPKKALEAVKSVKFEPFEIKLSRPGSFSGIFWAGVDGGEELYKRAEEVRAALGMRGIPYDRKKFSPHITLIRKPNADRTPRISPVDASMTVTKISLMRSERGADGMIYTEL